MARATHAAMGVAFGIELDGFEEVMVSTKLVRKALGRNGRSIIMREIVKPMMKEAVDTNYKFEGRPRAWPKLRPSTQARRRAAGLSSAPLNARGGYGVRKRNFGRVTAEEVEYGSNWASIVMHDRSQVVRSREIKARGKKVLRFVVQSGEIVYRANVVIGAKRPFTIPARQVIGMTLRDTLQIAGRVMHAFTFPFGGYDKHLGGDLTTNPFKSRRVT